MVKLFTPLLIICNSVVLWGQEDFIPPTLTFEHFKPYLDKSNDSVYVINFWATWCKPCIEEMPFFESAIDRFKEDPVRVLFVSLDFKNQINSKLIPFLRERNWKSQVVVLDAPNANSWIDKVEPTWSGAIPATLIYKNGQRSFHEKQFEDHTELESIIHSFINTN